MTLPTPTTNASFRLPFTVVSVTSEVLYTTTNKYHQECTSFCVFYSFSRLSRLAFTRRFVRCINGEFGKLFKNVDFCVRFARYDDSLFFVFFLLLLLLLLLG